VFKKIKKWWAEVRANIKTPASMANIIGAVIATLIASLIMSVFLQSVFDRFTIKNEMPNRQITIYRDNEASLFDQKINSSDLVVTYKGEIVQTLEMIEFTIQNTGKETIHIDDYEMPIFLYSNTGNRFLQATIKDSNNSILKNQVAKNISIVDNMIIFPTVLLNSGDYYTVTIILDRPPGSQSVGFDCRISGISNLKYIDRTERAQFYQQRNFITKTTIFISLIIFVPLGIYFTYTYKKLFYKNHKYKKNILGRLKLEYKTKIPKEIKVKAAKMAFHLEIATMMPIKSEYSLEEYEEHLYDELKSEFDNYLKDKYTIIK